MQNKIFEAIAIYSIVLSGIFGAYLVGLGNLGKLHYVPIALGLLYFYCYIDLKYKIMVMALVGIDATISNTAYAFLSSAQAFIIPIILLTYRPVNAVSSIKSALLLSLLIVFVGIVFELVGALPFRANGYFVQDVLHQRYAGFAGSPLAAAFVAVLVLPSLRNSKQNFRLFIVCIVLFVLYMARSRAADIGAVVTIFLLIVLLSYKSKFLYVKLAFIILSLIATLLLLDLWMGGAIFDWQFDKGNVGRLRQWSYCASAILNHPISGVGAGLLSPISEGYLGSIYIDKDLGIVRSCESTFLKICSEYGVLIGSVYGALFIAIVFKTVKSFRKILVVKKFMDIEICAMFYIIFIGLLQIFNQTLDSPWMSLIYFISIKHILQEFASLKITKYAIP